MNEATEKEVSIEPKMGSTSNHVAIDEPNSPTIENTEVTLSNDNNNHRPVVSNDSVEMANEIVMESDQSIDDKALTPDSLTVTVTYTFTFVLSILFSVSLLRFSFNFIQ